MTWFLLRPDLHRLVIVSFQDALCPDFVKCLAGGGPPVVRILLGPAGARAQAVTGGRLVDHLAVRVEQHGFEAAGAHVDAGDEDERVAGHDAAQTESTPRAPRASRSRSALLSSRTNSSFWPRSPNTRRTDSNGRGSLRPWLASARSSSARSSWRTIGTPCSSTPRR